MEASKGYVLEFILEKRYDRLWHSGSICLGINYLVAGDGQRAGIIRYRTTVFIQLLGRSRYRLGASAQTACCKMHDGVGNMQCYASGRVFTVFLSGAQSCGDTCNNVP